MLCDMGGHALSARGPGWSAAVLLVAAAGTLCVLGLAPRGAIARSIEIRGNHFVDGRRVIRLIGVDRSGSEYACSGPATGGGFGYGIFAGPVDDRAIRAMLTWKVNAVMVGLNEACWLGGYGRLNAQYTGRRYQAAIADYVRRLNARRLYVVLDLMGAAPGDNAFGSSTVSTVEIPMADADHSLTMWRSVPHSTSRTRSRGVACGMGAWPPTSHRDTAAMAATARLATRRWSTRSGLPARLSPSCCRASTSRVT
jgi:hypothetical protein